MKYRKRNASCKAIPFLLGLLLVMLSVTGCSKGRVTKETEDTTFGIDVSRYQGTVDWQKVADSDIDFAMIRVGYRTMSDGIIKEDPNARYNLQEAAAAELPVGVYFFSTAVSEEEAMEEAAWVADLISQYPITYPVVYDCEGYLSDESRQYHLTAAQRTDFALAFLKTIEDCGYEGMFYSSRNEMHNSARWEMERIDEDYKVWVAQYPAEPYPFTAESSYLGVHHMWQYTTEGFVPGIGQSVDMNVCYFGYDGIEPAKSREVPEKVGPDPEAMHNFTQVEETVTAKEETNLRSVPSQGEDSIVMLTLRNGQTARRIAVSSSGWSKLELDGTVYYAVSSYLTTDLNYNPNPTVLEIDGIQTKFNSVNYQVTAKQKVNLRKLPSVEHKDAVVIDQLDNGEIATCLGVSDNGWSMLSYNGTTCYAVSSYLTTVSTAASAPQVDPDEIQTRFESVSDRVTAKVEVNLRAMPSVTDPGAVVVATIRNGDIVSRTGINRDVGWSRVVYNGQTLYCVSSYLKVVEG